MSRELIRFTVSEDHLKLLKHMNIDWATPYLGAPVVDCKRPYGNGDTLRDIFEIVWPNETPENRGDGWEAPELSDRQGAKALKLHREMETALQILVCNCHIEARTYVAERYRATTWRPDTGAEVNA